jgi:glycosyltransferase involved in cell wall biosynthesis
MVPSDELAIYLPQGRIAPPRNPYGRLIANAGLYRAVARYGGYRNLHFQSHVKPPLDELAAELFGDGSAAVGISTGSPLTTEAPARAGVLLSGLPYLSEPAWIRRHSARDDAYSIVGSIFAFASPTHRERMMGSAMAPLQEWDALICTSPSLEEAVRRTFDHWEDYLRERTGAARLPRPALPVIPLGVDVERVEARAGDANARRTFRENHGISESDAVVLFLGRLSFYDKAYPQAMFKAVEAAQRTTGMRTHLIMAGWFPGEGDQARFEAAAQRHAPGTDTLFLDGNDAGVVAQCWAAADIFLLLSDTILETFGQALVEAMAAGLPLVVSDWDGYRFIVRDGVDGFLVPTLGGPSGPLGETLALLQAIERVDYPQYVGAVAQHTAVHVGRAAEALSRLIASPDLRASMGAAGRDRARKLFSWPVVVEQYRQLFSQLTERRLRAAAAGVPGSASTHTLDPLRADPFAQFRGYATASMHDDLLLAATSAAGPDAPCPGPSIELDDLFPGLRGSRAEAHRVLQLLREAGPLSVRELLADFSAGRHPFIRMSLVWLAKSGLVDWLGTD